MSSGLPPTPQSPGNRKKGPKTLPKLPLSAFSPPNTGTSEKFPLAPSPSTVHPEKVVDANVRDIDLTRWKAEAGPVLGNLIGGIVVSLPKVDAELVSKLSADKSLTSLVLPFSLDDTEHAAASVLSNSPVRVSLVTTFTKATPQAVNSLKWALGQGRPVDIDIHAPLSDDVFEGLEDLLAKARADIPSVPPIILSNLLPPPDQLELPLVKLMNHPTYRTFQAQIAALSLIPEVYIKYLPPSWNTAAPATPSDASPSLESAEAKQNKEWKRRIKMYLGPVMEAFGYQRIIFGSASSASTRSSLTAGAWYEIARESLAELGVEQEAVDAVFSLTALKVYG
ncbi:hypothetical protein VNI00_003983 [Paramarasmius palmivorus]|uniref:Uncharacterized protein n=1 Tax=Paramarasmius palmivorus TaxID=297713 RepID=A0AAW0DKQ8_9AGAR